MSSRSNPIRIPSSKKTIKEYACTPQSLRRNLIPRDSSKPSCEHNNFSNPKVKRCDSDSLLNTAFSLPSSASKTPVSANKKLPSTTLNACYTPSSLYRSITPKGKLITPKQNFLRSLNCDKKTPECFSKVKLDTPNSQSKNNVSAVSDNRNEDKGEISNLKVAVRIRPLNAFECLNPSVTNIVQIEANKLSVLAGSTADNSAGVSHTFQYDNIFWSANPDDSNYASQESVFQGIGLPLVEKAFEGYNVCLFAYGQTGSGKSYSMMGIETDDNDDIICNSEAGIIPRFCREIFRKITTLNSVQAELEISYFEIYNEKIHDLLSVSHATTTTIIDGSGGNQNRKNPLRVREHPVWGPYVVGLSTHPVNCYTSLRNWLAVGNSQRATAATGMNDQSSRSHSIFNIVLSLSEIEKSTDGTIKFKETKRSKVSLVDLAGSERISNSETSGDRIREGVYINKSLLTLGKVISALAELKRGTFVPYRESVLTWLLRENLGGNSRTVMLATISPASIHLDETLATLRYACQARAVVNRVKVNEDPHDKIIRELRAEVERLKALRQDYERQKRHSANNNPQQTRKIIIETSIDESEVEALRIQLAETEKELAKAQKSWMERLNEAENLRKFEIRMLKKKGLALELSAEQKQPCLVNLAADPILSGILLYILPPGIVRIGRSKLNGCTQSDIILEGPLVAPTHCSIENINGDLFLIPENHDFETFLNGELVQNRMQIFDGDRLVIGGTHYFRVSNPFCIKRNKSAENTRIIDFQLAHQEILQKQEEQLRRELDEEKKIALAQIELERVEHERNYREKYELLELEKFKFKCSKELLETEKKILQDKEEENKKFEYTPYKSTLLDDIKRIMQNPTKESLHKTQLMIKEANQRCRDIGLSFIEFKHSQIADEFGIFRTVITIIDRKNQLKAEWPAARLGVWLEVLREHEYNINPENIFKCVDIEWLPLDDNNLNETLNESLNSSRISLNLNAMKNAIFKCTTASINNSFQTISNNGNLNNSNSKNTSVMMNTHDNIRNTRKMLTYDGEYENNDTSITSNCSSSKTKDNFNTAALMYLKDLRKNTIKLKRLCDQYLTDENFKNKDVSIEIFRKSIEQIDDIVCDLKTKLTDESLSSSVKTPKSVRFLID